jgi:hypothetical protein
LGYEIFAVAARVVAIFFIEFDGDVGVAIRAGSECDTVLDLAVLEAVVDIAVC